ncbi:MAG: SAM-dependent chlorinase/fluorinase [Candidatus Hydrogenedentes bacterium]|nr:SAM-dependent chlorinase/fluorinase [Candidatus Hydrogenedentota bacterium]
MAARTVASVGAVALVLVLGVSAAAGAAAVGEAPAAVGEAPATVEANGLAILLTDYGADSIYVGMLKGAMYSTWLGARIDAITNSVPPFDIVTGAYVLAEACGAYPPGTTFCCVVDPGVGTARKCIVLRTKAGHTFVAPDNGLLTAVAERYGVAAVRECTNESLFYGKGSSSTFHGRDIFGPVAAALACGVRFEDVGPALERLVRLDLPRARIEGGVAHGAVVRADDYGNLVTNLTAAQLGELGIARGDRVAVTIGDAAFTAPYVHTYGSVGEGERLVLLQSSGFVECAINLGSLAEAVGAGPGADVALRKAE